MSGLYICQTIRTIEQQALAQWPTGSLMSRAATSIADQAERMLRQIETGDANLRAAQVLILAGPGNNGADALLAGLLLAERGYRIAACAPTRKINSGLAEAALNRDLLNHYDRLRIPIGHFSEIKVSLPSTQLIIDGLLGIGQSRPLADELYKLVSAVNQYDLPVLSVDVPTGLDANTGSISGGKNGICIKATQTLTLLRDKPGLHTGAGKELAGLVIVDQLGCSDKTPADGELFDASMARLMLPRRAINSNKGSFGSVLIMGGAQGMQGAALLAAIGAQAGGAGKVFISSPHQTVFVAEQAQWMSRAWPPELKDIDAIALGCGLGKSESSRLALSTCWNSAVALVLDADALNLLAEDDSPCAALQRHAATVMTPHPLEASRLLGGSTTQVQADRCGAAIRLAQKFNSVVCLKGAGSVIAAPDGRWSINTSGAPALAVAGTGDVLAGLVAALLAQGLSAWDAARLAAFSHGRAGEMMQQQQLPLGGGLAATELFHPIRQVLNNL